MHGCRHRADQTFIAILCEINHKARSGGYRASYLHIERDFLISPDVLAERVAASTYQDVDDLGDRYPRAGECCGEVGGVIAPGWLDDADALAGTIAARSHPIERRSLAGQQATAGAVH
jgi:hypothetical protein